jgi:hypothetical protein
LQTGKRITTSLVTVFPEGITVDRPGYALGFCNPKEVADWKSLNLIIV